MNGSPGSAPVTNKTLDTRVAELEDKLGKRSNVVGVLAHLFTIGIALFALFQAGRNNRLSADANRIANEALKTSTNQFIDLNRPYLTITLKKDKNGFFVNPEKHGTSVVHILDYEVRNVGNIGAKEVVFPENVATGPNLNVPQSSVSLRRPNPIGILPGATYPFRFKAEIPFANENAASNAFKKWGEGTTNSMTVGFSVTYKNSLDLSRTYRTFVKERISKESVVIIDSDFLDVSNEK